jgi:outer membrane receptor for ferric coprogen and ferric-rhodotorulic acid
MVVAGISLFTAVRAAAAQPVGAAISGIVTDTSGAVIPGAWLTLADAGSGVQRQFTANAHGEYAFGGLPPGRYVLSAGRDGFAPLQVANIDLADGERRVVPVVLKIAPMTENVAVTASNYAGDIAAGKRGESSREIPQSVSVLSQARIRDQNLTDVTEALNQITGITVTKSGDTVQQVYSRGFAITSVQADGGAPALFNTFNIYGLPDLAAYDHVEVLRGADGLFAGSGEAGGTVNLVRKRPLARKQILFDVQAGSWDYYRAQVDATGSLGWEGRLRGRVVLAQENRHYFYDVANSERTVAFGSLEADLSSRTLLTLGASYERHDALPFDTGLPRYTGGADLKLPRRTCLCTEWTYWNTSTPELFGKLEQSFANNWKLQLNLSHQRKDFETRYTRAIGAVDPVTRQGDYLWGNYVDYAPRQTLVDATVSGRFDVLGRRQDVVVGTNWQNVDADHYYYGGINYMVPVDVFAFNPADPAYADPGSPAYQFYVMDKWGQRQTGAYANLRSHITKALQVIGGVRYSSYRSIAVTNMHDEATGEVTSRTDQGYKTPDIWTPYGGLMYDLTPAVSLYGSYTQIFKPQGDYVTVDGVALPPVTGESYEFGAKGSWLSGSLTASAAAYRIERRDAAVSVPDRSGKFGDLNCCYVPAAKIGSKGFDGEVTGQLTRDWRLFAGYTYNINNYDVGYGARDGLVYMPQTPRHLLKLWTMVQLPGAWSAWSLGGGVTAQTSTTVKGNGAVYEPGTGNIVGSLPYVSTQNAYAVASLRGEYRINSRWAVALNVNNLLDTVYYQTVAGSPSGNFYGEPRNAMLTLRVRY